MKAFLSGYSCRILDTGIQNPVIVLMEEFTSGQSLQMVLFSSRLQGFLLATHCLTEKKESRS